MGAVPFPIRHISATPGPLGAAGGRPRAGVRRPRFAREGASRRRDCRERCYSTGGMRPPPDATSSTRDPGCFAYPQKRGSHDRHHDPCAGRRQFHRIPGIADERQPARGSSLRRRSSRQRPSCARFCDALAAEGYAALCPTFSGASSPGSKSPTRDAGPSGNVPSSCSIVFRRRQGRWRPRGGACATAGTIRHARVKSAVSVIVSRRQAQLSHGTRSDVDCSVGLLRCRIQDLVGEAKNIRKPLPLHIAEKDQFVPPPRKMPIKHASKGNLGHAPIAIRASGTRSRAWAAATI